MYVFMPSPRPPPPPWGQEPLDRYPGEEVKGPEMLHTKATGSGPQPQAKMTGSVGKCEGATLSGPGGFHVLDRQSVLSTYPWCRV